MKVVQIKVDCKGQLMQLNARRTSDFVKIRQVKMISRGDKCQDKKIACLLFKIFVDRESSQKSCDLRLQS